MWDVEKIEEFIRKEFSNSRVILASNREPYVHQRTKRGVRLSRPAGGLITALTPVMEACKGVWVAWGSGSADRDFVDVNDRLQVPPEDPKFTLRRVWMTESEARGFYHGFSNRSLWPLCHLQMDKTVFNESYWRAYRLINERFADAIIDEGRDGHDIAWLQDYHLALCPAFIRSRGSGLNLMIFWHIPWPPWEVFRIMPWRREILLGMLGCDMIGFHTEQFCHNFLECVKNELGILAGKDSFTVRHEGRLIAVKAFPISIDFDYFAENAQTRATERRMNQIAKEETLFMEHLGIGVDRLDYTKGIVERLKAIERFLEKYPQYVGKLSFVQVAAPSRTKVAEYRRLKSQVEGVVRHVNSRFGINTRVPIRYIDSGLSQRELMAYYRMADFAIVSSLHDGMNLVAKEFIASQVDRKGVLVCSEFAGAAEELENALLINPYDVEGFADTIKRAIEMPLEERRYRMMRLQEHVSVHNIYKWLSDIFHEMLAIMEMKELTGGG